jgi:signal peptidase II
VQKGIFKFTIVKNPGAALGLMSNKPFVLKVITSIIIIVLLAYTTIGIFSGKPAVEILPLAFISGGALGNFIDRIRFGCVTDFISFNTKFRRFPVFNLADLFILTGCGMFFANY